jgi:hypothetical protein
MADDSGAVPPPYASVDPLRPPSSQNPEALLQTRRHPSNAESQGIPSYQRAVDEDFAFLFTSATQYFEDHPPHQPLPRTGLIRHTLRLNEQSDATDVSFIPTCWGREAADVTQLDMATFANFLFPSSSTSQFFMRSKVREMAHGRLVTWADQKNHLEEVATQ